MKLVMTLLVRDEDDILALSLEHHLTQGIDRFIVTDNRSRDSTPQILRRYAERGLLEIIEEPGETYDQARWVTRMAERAAASAAHRSSPGTTWRRSRRPTPQNCCISLPSPVVSRRATSCSMPV